MSSEASVNLMAPPVFDETNYQVWAVWKEAYLDSNDQWEVVENTYEVPFLLCRTLAAECGVAAILDWFRVICFC
jgi:hypothetical protein